MEAGTAGGTRRLGRLLTAFLTLVVAGCGGDLEGGPGSDEDIPGLAEASEVAIVETEPDPSDGSCIWSHAYLFGDLPQINVGQPTAEFMEDAARDPAEASELVCFGDGSGSGGAAELDSPVPAILGVTFGGPDVRAWAWSNVPDQAVAVQFTDQDGTATWQRPVEGLVRLVVFPDTIVDDPDADCPCRFDAIDSAGVVVASVDIRTGTYIND